MSNTTTNTKISAASLGASDDHDPITAEVIRSAFDNITTEMSLVLLRTSGSPVLTESKDFSTVLFDDRAQPNRQLRLYSAAHGLLAPWRRSGSAGPRTP